MPRFDDEDLKIKQFKKKTYRGWDHDSLDELRENTKNELRLNHVSKTSKSRLNNVLITSKSHSNQVQTTSKERLNNVQIAPDMRLNDVENPHPNTVAITSNKDTYSTIKNLRGNEETLFFYIIDLCTAKSSLSPGDLTSKEICELFEITRDALDGTLKRLQKKGLISRKGALRGCKGYLGINTFQKVKDEALTYQKRNQQDILINKELRLNYVQKEGSNYALIASHDSTISSNSINNKTTTALPEEWQKIGFESLAGIGFTASRLLDIYEAGTNTAEVVQGSINHFAYMLERHPEKYKDPLNVLIGTLRKGKDWFEKDYKSPQELAMQRMVEQKKRELERKEKLEKALFDLHYKEWESSLDEETKNALMPESARRSNMQGLKTAELVKYFTHNLWPEVKAKNL